MGRNSHIPAEDTEQFIIEKAAELFNKKGFWGTSLSDLEKATGLTKGSIYSNFKDKTDVSLKVFDYNYNKLREPMGDRVKGKTTAKEKLMACIDFYITYFPSMKSSGGCAIQNALIDSDDTNIALFEKAKSALGSWKDTLQKIIEAGIQNGEFRRELNAGVYSAYLIAIIEGAILVGKSLDSHQLFSDMLAHLKEEITRI
ncbi:TetR/AcrR family transcriptional regulator [Desertivirga arenae]|uniref:TetR/AcrR family transcriptional regulator n=1 Tax=Desertivirga arenae TaxID=2810309 RepID=UPI001A9787B0|nr:TetR/AcrR family transcriptional regulator [Pedobacter sp. SYSU D00823]